MARKREEEHGREKEQEQKTQGPEDLKEREYRDKEGNVHHHTRKYMEQHGEGEERQE